MDHNEKISNTRNGTGPKYFGDEVLQKKLLLINPSRKSSTKNAFVTI